MFTVNIPKEVEKMRTVWSLTFLKPLQRLVIFPLFISHCKYSSHSLEQCLYIFDNILFITIGGGLTGL